MEFNVFKYRILLILCSIYLMGILSAIGTENPKIRRIRFEGNESISSKEILSHLSINSGLFPVVRKLKKNDFSYYDPHILADEEKRVRLYYQRQGFLYVEVSSKVIPVRKNEKRIDVEFIIKENSPIKVDAIEVKFTGNQPGQLMEEKIGKEFREARKLKTKFRFNDDDLLYDQTLLQKVTSENGFAYNQNEYDLKVDTMDNNVDVSYLVSLGNRCYIGSTSFEMQDGTPENRSFLPKYISYDKGDVFASSELDKTQKQIYGIGLYNVVSVVPDKEKIVSDTIPILVRLRKASPYKVKFGIGYGKEERVRTFADFQYLGFLGGIRRLNLFLKYSYLEPYHIDFKLTQPAIWGIHSSLVVRPYLMKQNEPGYTLVKYGSDIFLNKKITRNLSATVGTYAEVNDLDTTSIGYSSAFRNGKQDYYNKTGLSLGAIFDNTKPLFNPFEGWILAANSKYSGLANSTYQFLKLLAEVRNYRKVAGVILAWKVKYGVGISYDDNDFIPVDERFYAGGGTSVRGWQRAYLGPIGDDKIPIGGKSHFESSIETRIPLVDKLYGVVFMDTGNVWEDTYAVEFNDLRYAAGAGIRFETPIGPIRFDMARPVWDEKKSWQWHLSVGHAF